MKVQEVILRAMSKQITWWQAAEILGVSARSLRRYRQKWIEHGYDGLFDRRRQRPSPKRVAVAVIEQVLTLYRDHYFDFNVRHFHEKLVREHDIALSYTWVKKALQAAGLIATRRKRGRHHKRRARRPVPGMLLHIDGSSHAWLGPQSGMHDLITIMDDATSEIYYAQLVEQESTATVMTAIKTVIEQKGLFCSLYSDRASHFFYTPKAGASPDRATLTQVGRALTQLGIEPIPAGSPQARGRCERSYGTLQGRLPQELRIRSITTREAANRFLDTQYRSLHNQNFSLPAEQSGTAFVPYSGVDLEKIFSRQSERVVGNDNTITVGKLHLQIERQTFRFSMAKCRVLVCEHLDGTITVYYGPHQLGRYAADGSLIKQSKKRKTAA